MVSQSVASAAVSYSMTKGSSTMAMSGDNSACHDEEGLIDDTKGPSTVNQNTVGQDKAVEQRLEMASDDSDNCCDIDCHCPSGHCSSAALSLHFMPNGRLHRLSQNIEYPSQWGVSQSPSSLYRPPISL